MAVTGFPAIGMPDDNHFSVGAFSAGKQDRSIADTGNRGPVCCGVIDAMMGPSDFENGMKTIFGETGADSPEIERRF